MKRTSASVLKRNVCASRRQRAGKARSLLLLAGAAGTALVLGGCNVDSYMDPSVVGRWEDTVTKSSILDRFVAYEGPANEGIETSKVRAEDLIPEVEAYRVGPGDALELTVEDFFRDGVPLRIENLEVDPRGFVDLPQVGGIFVYGQTTDQMVASVRKSLSDAGVLKNAVVNVIVRSRRKLTYGILGAVDSPGFYSITKPDFRLMDALSQAGRFDQQLDKVIVIRRIPLSDRVTGRPTGAAGVSDVPMNQPAGNGGGMQPMPPSGSGGKKPAAVDIIDELSKPGTNAPAPSMFSSTRQPTATGGGERKPVIDLVDPMGKPTASTANGSGAGSMNGGGGSASQWVFVNGQWVQQAGGANGAGGGATTNAAGPGLTPIGATASAEENPASELMTQRVIEIPLAPLLAGSAQYNIVIRPGDTIRVPTRGDGVFYVAGQVARPGPYNLPTNGKMTIMRAIDSAGGFGSAAIPERVDLTRMVGPDRQVTIKVNYRAISEGTHPDIAIKPDDRINVGSNFFAYPMAVVRNGLRASYGFGFILDRNFGYDVFGPQRTNDPNQ
ncbi:MAG: polysaccharide biosynthesis/export family protein [Phycisphaerales bacterium]|nr:polysaccharide biosynthesis/export family protein [Phycisphaerales bacterium]